MSSNHIIQYSIIAVIAVLVVIAVIRHIIKIRNCSKDSEEGYCQCCASKSLCGKKKKHADIAESKK